MASSFAIVLPATAKAKADSPSAWLQCEMTLQSLAENVAKLPDADWAPFLAKIKDMKPAIAAGEPRERALMIARHIKDTLDGAREELAAARMPADFYFEKLDGSFAEPDLKSLPADELKKLQADYADVKKRSSK